MRIAVFCGSSQGNDDRFARSARELGHYFATQGIDLVYGGGKVGLMGEVADAALAAGGRVFGVIPESLRDRELAHPGLTDLQVVSGMHERKAMMAEQADAFVAMPGGPGTMDELFEAWTWAQLGYHDKPCAIYNAFGYYDQLLSFLGTMVDSGFMKPHYRQMLVIEDQPGPLLGALLRYQPPRRKWS